MAGRELGAWSGSGRLDFPTIDQRLLAQYWVLPLQLVPYLGSFIGLWAVVDNAFALGHPQRRSLHDRFAGTVVVDGRAARALAVGRTGGT